MNGNPVQRPVDILLVEDNPGDVRLAREALREAGLPHRLSVAGDGDAMLAFLRRERADFKDAPRPDLILLDLNLPGRGGLELLAEIKADPALRQIPVVILSMSKADKDIQAAYQGNANCYICKPIDFAHFIEVMRGIATFWFGLVQLPSRQGGYG